MALGNWPLLQYSLCITSPLPCQSDINCEGHMEHMRVHVLREGQTIPERRFVETVNHEAYNYQIGDFPAEWEAWIRKKREDPPTIEEILRNENYREEMKQKVKDVSEKDKLLQAKEYEEGLVAEPSHTQVKGHASAPYYGKKEPSQDPTSTANTFQPGAWMPPGSGSGQNK
ncbi:NADH dehydrogenase [ubiquinone] 1 alpha subcomplex assembly factor 2 isoform X1 [Parus major]|uniref:NADH dehydrogenase [ubiquinone] 1 alpha subcomplex assembly factor 2 isoform X1 n=1 Tax=Parus major TaxID=9157 RepID=UPI001443F791|nr:NADH dehydrogenase [ubiquinone] 1 alpha subcomplex assembly factor 2 isoform X1 [Parus major]